VSQPFSDLLVKALAVRDHYNELQKTDGKKTWNAQDRMAGFVGDVGTLSKLVMVKHGLRRGPENIDEELAHELSDCLWSIVVLADELGVDLEQSFIKSMSELHERIEEEKANKSQYLRGEAA
jgi:NTP pyrophosphatase (non-canonical NTP hydrolase)